MQSLIPVVMAGIIAVYSLVIAVLIAGAMDPSKKYSLFKYVPRSWLGWTNLMESIQWISTSCSGPLGRSDRPCGWLCNWYRRGCGMLWNRLLYIGAHTDSARAFGHTCNSHGSLLAWC